MIKIIKFSLNNYLRQRKTTTRSRYKRYPDFYNEDTVLDAKYKHLEDGSIGRDDMHQLVAYMHVLKSKYGGFIYPFGDQKKNEVKHDINHRTEIEGKHHIGRLQGHGGEIFIYGFWVPTEESYPNFCVAIKKAEDNLKDFCTIN